MRGRRIKIPAEEEMAAYHVISHTVNGERLLDEKSREVFCRQMWTVAEFCGVKILTYAILDNHFHILILVPRKEVLSDEELLRRYEVLYPTPTRHRAVRLTAIRSLLASSDLSAQLWRKRQLALMGDLSQFLKLLKLRFSIWYNHTHQRFGTLWAERFKSLLVEPVRNALLTVGAYIDLNAVRESLVADPKDYRFCGYAEAMGGSIRAQNGLMMMLNLGEWRATQEAYRLNLFSFGTAPMDGGARISQSSLRETVEAGGRLPLAVVLRCRLKYLSDGAILGSQRFVESQINRLRINSGRPHAGTVQPLPAEITDWGGLTIWRRLRGELIRAPG